MKELTETDAQKEYAEKIRAEVFSDIAAVRDLATSYTAEEIDAAIEYLRGKTSAEYWIKGRETYYTVQGAASYRMWHLLPGSWSTSSRTSATPRMTARRGRSKSLPAKSRKRPSSLCRPSSRQSAGTARGRRANNGGRRNGTDNRVRGG
jgi:hypothetical protein